MEVDFTKYLPIVRDDFSMILLEREHAQPQFKEITPCMYLNTVGVCTKLEPCEHKNQFNICTKSETYDRCNDSEDGYQMGSKSKMKIRANAIGMYLQLGEKQRSNLRFLTLTFPNHPKFDVQDQYENDQFCYRIFKKFLDNERVNYKLDKYLWVTERHVKNRDIIHFHCLFLYEKQPDYTAVSFRFLRLLDSNGFPVFNKLATNLNNVGVSTEAITALRGSDYTWLLKNKERLFCTETVYRTDKRGTPIRDKAGNKMAYNPSIFIAPLHFDRIIKNISHLAGYLSKYISSDEANDKIYCRRWASSRGLRLDAKQEIFTEFTEEEVIHFYTDLTETQKQKGGYDEKELKPIRFTFKVNDMTRTGYYFPPLFTKWSLDDMMRDYFQAKFGYTLT